MNTRDDLLKPFALDGEFKADQIPGLGDEFMLDSTAFVPDPLPAAPRNVKDMNLLERFGTDVKVGAMGVAGGLAQNAIGYQAANAIDPSYTGNGAFSRVTSGMYSPQQAQFDALPDDVYRVEAEQSAKQTVAWTREWMRRNVPAGQNFGDEAVGAFGSMLMILPPAIVAGLAGGPNASAAVSAMVESAAEQGNVEAELIDRYKMSAADAHNKSMWVFYANLPVAYLTDKALLRFLPDSPLVKQLAGLKGFRAKAGLIAKDAALNAGKEFTQEFTQEGISTVAVGDKLKLSPLLHAGAVGAVVGGGMSSLAVPAAVHADHNYVGDQLAAGLEEGPLGSRPALYSPYDTPESVILRQLEADPAMNPRLARTAAEQEAAQTAGNVTDSRSAESVAILRILPNEVADTRPGSAAPGNESRQVNEDLGNGWVREDGRATPTPVDLGNDGASDVGAADATVGAPVAVGSTLAVAPPDLQGFSFRPAQRPVESPGTGAPRMSRAADVRPDSRPGGTFDWRAPKSFYLKSARVIAETMPDNIKIDSFVNFLKRAGVSQDEIDWAWSDFVASRQRQGDTTIGRGLAMSNADDALQNLGRSTVVIDRFRDYAGRGENYQTTLELPPEGVEFDFEAHHYANIGHTRTTDGALGDGTPVRTVEEIQSDAHQRGREQGYGAADKPQAILDWEKELRVLNDKGRELVDALVAEAANARHTYNVANADAPFLGATGNTERLFMASLVSPTARDLALQLPYASTKMVVLVDEMAAWAQSSVRAFEQRPTGAYVPWWSTQTIADSALAAERLRDGGSRNGEQMLAEADEVYATAELEVERAHGEARPWEAGVPDIPHKKTWHERQIKRAVIDAVGDNKSGIAWTGGVEHADRYSTAMRGAVQSINWSTKDDLVGSPSTAVYVKLKNGLVKAVDVEPGEAGHRQLVEYFGRKVADAIVSQPGGGHIEGRNLSIGATGFQAFYDEKVSGAVKKLVAPFGGSVENDVEVYDASGSQREFPVHFTSFTQSLIDAVRREGLPLFKRAAARQSAKAAKTPSFHDGLVIVEKPKGAAAKVARKLGTKLGLQVVFSDGGDFDAAFLGTVPGYAKNTVIVNLKSDKPLLALVAHEAVHYMKTEHGEMFSELRALVRSQVRDNAGMRAIMAKHRASYEQMAAAAEAAGDTKTADKYRALTEDDMVEEFIGDLFAEAAGDETFWARVADESQELFQTLRDLIGRILNELRAVLAEYPQDRTIREMLADVSAVEAAMAKAAASMGVAEQEQAKRRAVERTKRVKWLESFQKTFGKKISVASARNETKAIDRLVREGVKTLTTMANDFGADPDNFRQWYREDMARTYSILENEIPGISTDPQMQKLMTVFLALTSPRQSAAVNFNQAVSVMREFVKTGTMPIRTDVSDSGKTRHALWSVEPGGRKQIVGGKQMTAIMRSAIKAEEAMGRSGDWRAFVDWLSEQHTYDEFVQVFGKPAGGIKKGGTSLGALQYGPKVARFFENLAGVHRSPVLDVWFTAWAYARLGDLLVTKQVPGEPLKGLLARPKREARGVPGGVRAWAVFDKAIEQLADKMGEITGEVWGPDEVQATLWDAEKALYRQKGFEPERVNQYHIAALDRARRNGYGPEAEAVLARIGESRGPRRLREAGPSRSADGRDAGGAGGAGVDPVATGARGRRFRGATARSLGQGSGDSGVGRTAWDVNREGQGGLRLLRGVNVPVVAEYAPGPIFDKVARGLGGTYYKPGKFLEIRDPQFFHDQLAAAAAADKRGLAVTVFPPEYYGTEGVRTFVTENGSAGFAIAPNGELVSVFKHPKRAAPFGVGTHMTMLAVEQGARHLMAFDTQIPDLYARPGFRVVSRIPFDDDQAPDGWFGPDGEPIEEFREFNGGRPDVVFMVYDGGEAAALVERIDTFPVYAEYKASVPYSQDYDAAEVVQMAEVARLENDDAGGVARFSRPPTGPGPASTAIMQREDALRKDLKAEAKKTWGDRWHAVRAALFDEIGALDWRMVEAINDAAPVQRKQAQGLLKRAGKNVYTMQRLAAAAPSLAAAFVRHGIPSATNTDEIVHIGLDEVLAKHGIDTEAKQRLLDIVLVAGQLEDYDTDAQGNTRLRSDGKTTLVSANKLVEYRRAAAEIVASPDGADILAAAREVASFNEAFLKWCRDMGTVSPTLFNLVTDMYTRWVPLHQLALVGPDGRPRGGRSGVKAAPGLQHATGFDLETVIASPLETIQRNVHYMVTAAIENEVKLVMAEYAPLLPGVIDRARPKMAAQTMTVAEGDELVGAAVEAAMDSAGLTDHTIRDLIGASLTTAQLSALRSMWRVSTFQEDGVIAYRKDGDIKYLKIDAVLFDLFKSLSNRGSHQLLDLLSLATKIQRAGITSTLGFASSNLMRDYRQAIVMSETVPYPAEMWRGLVAAVKKDDHYWRWIYSRGGNVAAVAPDKAIERIRRLNQSSSGQFAYTVMHPAEWLHLMQVIGEGSDSIPRITANMARRRALGREPAAGRSPQDLRYQASFGSRQVSLDFLSGGTLIRQANRTISFLNARVLGQKQLVMAVKTRPVRTMAMAMLVYTVPRLMTWWWQKDEEWYKRQPAWMKFGYYIFPMDAEGKNLALFPKGQELAYLFDSSVEAMLNAWYNEDPKAVSDWFMQLAKGLNWVDLPTAIKPAYEAMVSNHNSFTDGPVVSQRLQPVPPRYQYDATSPEILKLVADSYPGRIMRVSPLKLNHMVSGYFGTWGKTAVNLASDALTLADPSRKRPVRSRHKMFGIIPMERTWLVGRYFRSSMAASSVYVDRFDSALNESVAATRTLKTGMMKNRDRPDEMRELVEYDIENLLLFKCMNNAADDIQAVVEYVGLIESEPEGEGKFTGDEKRDIRDARMADIDVMAQTAMHERKMVIDCLATDPSYRKQMVDEALAGVEKALADFDKAMTDHKRSGEWQQER